MGIRRCSYHRIRLGPLGLIGRATAEASVLVGCLGEVKFPGITVGDLCRLGKAGYGSQQQSEKSLKQPGARKISESLLHI